MNTLSQNKFNLLKDKILLLAQIVLGFVCMVMLCSASIGTLYVFFDIKWGWSAIIITTIVSVVLTVKLTQKEIFKFDTFIEFILFCLLELLVFVIYIKFSPALELRQDPSLYIFKALNLVNYGYTYKPMPIFEQLISNNVLNTVENEYALFQNGTQYAYGELHTDFFPGGTFVYAIFGKICKKYIFLGQTAIMMLAAALFFFVLKNIVENKHKCIFVFLYSIVFFVSPVIVFFGRGSFSEDISIVMILFVLCVLVKEKPDMLLLIIGFLVLYSARMDFMVVSIIGIFVITYYSQISGCIYSVLLLLVNYIYNKSYFIYSARIMENDMKILNYTPYIIIFVFLVSILICKFFPSLINRVYYLKVTKYVFFAIGVVVLLLMFRDNVAYYTGYKTAIIHGQNIMTYEEFIMDLLFMVFPAILIVGGILTLYDFVGNKNRNIMINIFFVLALLVYLTFFINGNNSPQLYWLLRRYIYIILPFVTIAFCAFMSKYDIKINFIISIFTLFVSVNIYFNAHLGIEYGNLNNEVYSISYEWKNDDIAVVLYDEELRYEVSPLLTYCDIEFIPLATEDIESVCQYLKDNVFDLSRCKIISKEKSDNAILREIAYSKQREEYGEVPTQNDLQVYEFYEYTGNQFIR